MATLDELKRAEQERQLQERQNKKSGLYNMYKTVNGYRNDIGNWGRQLNSLGQQYNNQGLQKVGSAMNKWTGGELQDKLTQNVGQKVGQLFGNKADSGLNTLVNTGNKLANPTQIGESVLNNGIDKLSTELAQQGLQQGGSALTDAIGNEVAGSAGQAGSSTIADAAATEVGTGAAQAAGTGLAEGAGTAATTAGTTAGATGATAAGTGAATGAAAGTAATGAATGAASAGMAAVPIIGWAALAAKLGYDMYNAHKKKQQAAAMQADQTAMDEMEQDQNQAFAQQAQDEQQMQKYTDMLNQQLGQGGADNPYLKQIEDVRKQQEQSDVNLDEWQGDDGLSEDVVSAQPQENVASQVGGEAVNAGTGLLSNVLTGTDATPDNYKVGQLLSQAEAPSVNDRITNFLNTKLEENANTGVPAEVSAPTQSLVEQVNPEREAREKELYDKYYAGKNDFAKGYFENATHAMGDTRATIPEAEKNWKVRLGEGLGTASRIAQNPLVQGLVAGGIDYAVSKNPKSALKTASDYATSKGQTNSYRDLLQQGDNPMYYNPGVLGQLSSSDYRTILQQPLQESMMDKYKQEALAKSIANKQLELQVQNNPRLNGVIAAIGKNPENYQKILAGHPDLTENDMNIISAYISNPDLMKTYHDSRSDYNTYTKNKTEERKQDFKEKHPEYYVKNYGKGNGGYNRSYVRNTGFPNSQSNKTQSAPVIGQIINKGEYGSQIAVPDDNGNPYWVQIKSQDDMKKARARIDAYNKLKQQTNNQSQNTKPQAQKQDSKRIRHMLVDGDLKGAWKKFMNPAGLDI